MGDVYSVCGTWEIKLEGDVFTAIEISMALCENLLGIAPIGQYIIY